MIGMTSFSKRGMQSDSACSAFLPQRTSQAPPTDRLFNTFHFTCATGCMGICHRHLPGAAMSLGAYVLTFDKQ